jgi:dihydrodipicolinate synthase/N-acetylneuraminate lyase
MAIINCGAQGTVTGIGNALPDEVLHLTALCKKAAAGDAVARVKAKELSDALHVLSTFDEGPDLVLFYKHLMVLNGEQEYALHLNESDRFPTVSATMSRRSTGFSVPGMRSGTVKPQRLPGPPEVSVQVLGK